MVTIVGYQRFSFEAKNVENMSQIENHWQSNSLVTPHKRSQKQNLGPLSSCKTNLSAPSVKIKALGKTARV